MTHMASGLSDIHRPLVEYLVQRRTKLTKAMLVAHHGCRQTGLASVFLTKTAF
jgi:hypothetical protein